MLTTADPAALARRVVRDVLTPRPRPRPDEWLAEHRRLPTAGLASDRPGRWSVETTPYLREILRAAVDPRVREVYVQKSAGMGFTEALIGLTLYEVAVLSAASIFYLPSQDLALRTAGKRFRPAIASCPPMDAVRTGRAHDEKTLEYEFTSGAVFFAWMGSKLGAKSTHVSRLKCDEFDEYPEGALEQLRSRVQTYASSCIVLGGTPVDEGAGIDVLMPFSDQRRFFVPCPFSGRYFEPWAFGLLRWDGSLDADPNDVERLAWMQSPFTPANATEAEQRRWRIDHHAHKPWMLRHGVWVKKGEEVESDGSILSTRDEPLLDDRGVEVGLSRLDSDALRTLPRRRRLGPPPVTEHESRLRDRAGVRLVGDAERPDSQVAGFRINALCSPFQPPGWIVRGFVEAHGRPGPKWVQDRLGQAWKIPGDRLGVGYLRKLCTPADKGGYRAGVAPEPVRFVVAAADVQKDHAWLLWLGVAADGLDFWYLGHAMVKAPDGENLAQLDGAHLPVDPDHPLGGRLLGSSFPRAGAGERVPVAFAGVDHGHRADEVEALFRRCVSRRLRLMMVKGDGTVWRHTEPSQSKTKTGLPLLNVPVNRVKDSLAAMLTPPAAWSESAGAERPARFHLPEDCPDEFLVHLSSEHRVSSTAKHKRLRRAGRGYTVWEPRPGNRPNHLWDLCVYIVALVDFVGVHRLVAADAARTRGGPAPALADAPAPADDGPRAPHAPHAPHAPRRPRTIAQRLAEGGPRGL